MPPKKKPIPAPTPAKSSQPESIIDEQAIPVLKPQKIPKRPHFRRNVDCNSLTRAGHIQIKFWKIHSLKFKYFDSEVKHNDFWEYRRLAGTRAAREEKFADTFKHSTIKKSLKFLKKIELDPQLLPKYRFLSRLATSWKLDSLLLLNRPKINTLGDSYEINMHPILKPFLNSKLKQCALISRFGEIKDLKLISKLRIFKKCNIFIYPKRYEIRMHLNADKLLRCHKRYQFVQEKSLPDHNFISNDAIINSPDCFKDISYECFEFPDMEGRRNIIPDLPPLSNLEKLRFTWHIRDKVKKFRDISFVKQYSNLKTLSIQLDNIETENLDYLVDLPYLREFYFGSSQTISGGPLKTLPNLTKLEKIGISLSGYTTFEIKDVRDFILKNENLKYLNLSLSAQNMGILFGDEDFILPHIDSLGINFNKVENPYAGAAKIVAQTLKKQTSIKKLSLEIEQSKADLNAILLKDGLAHMKSLEEMELNYKMTGGLEENKFKHLKDVFTNLVNLRSLDFNLAHDIIAPRELNPILDGLSKLQRLDVLKMSARMTKPTPSAYNKLSSFLVSVRHIKNLYINVLGFSEEDELELKSNLLPRFTL